MNVPLPGGGPYHSAARDDEDDDDNAYDRYHTQPPLRNKDEEREPLTPRGGEASPLASAYTLTKTRTSLPSARPSYASSTSGLSSTGGGGGDRPCSLGGELDPATTTTRPAAVAAARARRKKGSVDSTTRVSYASSHGSSAAARTNHLSFDDTGHAANYLQFFKGRQPSSSLSPETSTTTTTSTLPDPTLLRTPPVTASSSSTRLDAVYSVDNTTRVPLVVSALQQQKQQQKQKLNRQRDRDSGRLTESSSGSAGSSRPEARDDGHQRLQLPTGGNDDADDEAQDSETSPASLDLQPSAPSESDVYDDVECQLVYDSESVSTSVFTSTTQPGAALVESGTLQDRLYDDEHIPMAGTSRRRLDEKVQSQTADHNNNKKKKNSHSRRTRESRVSGSQTSARIMAPSSSEDSDTDASSYLYQTKHNHYLSRREPASLDLRREDSLSVLSSASHLFGESLLSVNPNNTTATSESVEQTLSSVRPVSNPALTVDGASSVGSRSSYYGSPWWTAPKVWVQSKVTHLVRSSTSRFRAQPVQLSPRSRNLADLQYLTEQHKSKVQQITTTVAPDMDHGIDGVAMDTTDDDDAFDFCLILQPQELYGFWADLLDFRVELLGQDVVDVLDQNWNAASHQNLMNAGSSTESPDSNHSTTSSSSENGSSGSGECQDAFLTTPPPVGGVRRRRTVDSKATHGSARTAGGDSNSRSRSHSSTSAGGTPMTPAPRRRLLTGQSSSRRSFLSPGLYSVSAAGGCSTVKKKRSVFERAVETTPSSPDGMGCGQSTVGGGGAGGGGGTSMADRTPAMSRRRWGNQVLHSTSQKQKQHSLHNSMTPKAAPARPRLPTLPRSESGADEPRRDPNSLRQEDIPATVIARGMKRINGSTNGMLPFLEALKHGIVLRKHRPGHEANFCRISSTDGGDTIAYHAIAYDDAMLALRDQRVRFNKDVAALQETLPSWSLDEALEQQLGPHTFSVPDYVAADAYRKRHQRLIGRRVTELASKVVGGSGSARMADICAVHPARNKDPRSRTGEMGSGTLRRSQSEYESALSFSVVAAVRGTKLRQGLDELEAKWHDGDGHDNQFRYLDFEAATPGEYWLCFRGLLLLHRDASVGRFAKQRAKGFGTRIDQHHHGDNNSNSHNGTAVDMHNHTGILNGNRKRSNTQPGADNAKALLDVLHQDEFHEPRTVGRLEKLIVRWRDLDTSYMEGFVTKKGAEPPPSDYFLGFKGPGTAIWSRLRQAGLETRRVYSLDPNRVMIKVRCPVDRQMDVAEVLRVKLKTKHGSFAPFREDMLDSFVFDALNDPLEQLTIGDGAQFRSSIRQAIIHFIVGSRIRDSGAELGPTTDLGQKIQARVPLHTPRKLEAIYHSWFYFWKKSNWRHGRTGQSLTHATVDREGGKKLGPGLVRFGDDESNGLDGHHHGGEEDDDMLPGVFTRFLVGSMHQPLDSIEQYFGEKVAFYFTWLQHTAAHLVFLSGAGLILFICQMSSGNADHPLRPYFAVVVMIWTFVVLVNWKKRANFMAYRWGTIDYKEQETTRPQFKGDYTQDEITGEWIVTYPKWKRWLKYCISFPLTLLFTSGTLVLILWVHANRDLQLAEYKINSVNGTEFEFERFALSAIGERAPIVEVEVTSEDLVNPEFWIIVVGLPSMLGLFLPLLNFLLMRLSIMLNDFENYRTESEYRTYLIIKVFSFRFICYFATLYYYAVMSMGDETAIANGILRVGTGVLVYTTVAQWWQNVLHVCFPMLIRKLRMNHRSQRLTDELREIELEEEEIASLLAASTRVHNLKERQARLINKRLLLEQAQDDTWLELMYPAHDSFPEYIQAVVQFTFVSCFSVVLPITPIIVLFNYLVSMRLDAYKLCKGRRRPLAEKTGGIGVWEHLLHIVAVISVLTNCWLMGFTSSQFTWIRDKNETGLGDIGLFAIVVGWEHIMLLIKYVMSTSMSTLPRSVRDEMKREQYELDKQRTSLMQERRKQSADHDGSNAMIDISNLVHHRQSRDKWPTSDNNDENSRMVEV